MKKILSLLLCLCMVSGMIVLPSAAEIPPMADNTPEEIAIMQQAVVEMAQSYLRRTEDSRYDFESLVILDRFTNGVGRISTDTHLGAAAPDDHFITNCAQFTYNVYYNCFGVGPNGGNSRTSNTGAFNDGMTMEHPEMILRYGKDGLTDKKEFYNQMLEVLQPGDLLYMRMKNGQNHAMIHVGDVKGDGQRYIIHSTGDSREIMGDTNKTTIRIDNLNLLSRDTGSGVFNPNAIYYFVLRPVNCIDFSQLTSDARARLENPGATFVRTADVWKYMDVQEGQEISVKTSIRNDGKKDFTDIAISDPAPSGAELIPDSISAGGAVKDGGVEWKLSLAPGKSVDLTYKVKVTAKAGEKVVLPENTVAGIRGRELSWYVGGTPIPTEPLAALKNDPEVKGLEFGTVRKELEMANIVYREVLGMDLGLPATMQELMDGILDVNGFKMLEPKSRENMTPEFQRIYDMIIPDHLGGQVVLLGIDPVSQFPHNRVQTYFPQAYRPGDIFLIFQGEETAYQCKFYKYCSVAIYLGDGKVLTADKNSGGLMVKNFEETITQTLYANVMITLRPSCAFPDPLTHLHMEQPSAPEVPESQVNPDIPGAPEPPEEPSNVPAVPVAEQKAPVGLIIGIVAAVAACVIVIFAVLKKKK